MRVRPFLHVPFISLTIAISGATAQAQSTSAAPTRPPPAARATTPARSNASAAPAASPHAAAPRAAGARANGSPAARASSAPSAAPAVHNATTSSSGPATATHNAPASAPPPARAEQVAAPPSTAPSNASAPPATPAEDHRAAIARIEAQAAHATPESARAIAQTILRGAAPDVTATALDALAALARPEGAPAVAHSLRHRRALVRRHAISAARAIHTPELVDALGDLLGDPDAAVRLDAALALSEVGSRAVSSRVLEAFERDLDDAQGPDGGPLTRPCALAIGKFGSSDDVHHLLGFLGRAPLRAITDAMREAVRRPALAETLRVQIVTAIGRLATRDARLFLETVIADAGNQDNALVRAARESAARIGE